MFRHIVFQMNSRFLIVSILNIKINIKNDPIRVEMFIIINLCFSNNTVLRPNLAYTLYLLLLLLFILY